MWYIYQSTINRHAKLDPDAYPVPDWCDPASAARFTGTNAYIEKVAFLAAKVDPAKVDTMPEWHREDYDRAMAEGANVNDFVLNPHKLS